jgi:cellulose synthase/poly-beta-1,6-N-acetylglucosamine synthase-like glycosyltransferase
MQKIAKLTNYKIKFCFNPLAMTGTMPNENLKQFYRQRTRWASKSLFYIDKILIAKLVLIFFFYLSLIISLAAAIAISPVYLLVFAIGIIMKMIPEYLVLSYGWKSLFKRENFTIFLLAEILHVPYIVICAVAGLFGNYKWKGRTLER